jgi:hypothetical protein
MRPDRNEPPAEPGTGPRRHDPRQEAEAALTVPRGVGTGSPPLRAALDTVIAETGCSLKDLTVLADHASECPGGGGRWKRTTGGPGGA